jgi:hypothetical protein
MTKLNHTIEQTEALWKSAEHWLWDNCLGSLSDHSISETACACCNLWHDPFCEGCPISQYTKKVDCGDTFYDLAASRMEAVSLADEYEPAFLEAAEAEYRFLVSLALGEEPEL